MWFTRFKVLPLLIFLSMVAFSVRFVEMTGGLSTMMEPVQAVAAEEESQEDVEVSSDKAAPRGDTMFEVEDNLAVGEKDTTNKPLKETKRKTQWMDATDADLEFEDVKIEMFQDLSKRRQIVEAKEKEIATREALLSAAEKELERKYQELAVIRAEIEELLQKQTEEEKERISSLVSIYEGMKAKNAADIFNTLDIDILVTVMSQMSERKVSPILAQMNAERARAVTIMLAEQKKLPLLPENN